MDLGLKDSVVIVTGGGAGIGQAISRACLDEGATVVVVSRASENVTKFLADMREALRPVVEADPLPEKGMIELDPSRTPRIELQYDPFANGEAARYSRPEKF